MSSMPDFVVCAVAIPKNTRPDDDLFQPARRAFQIPPAVTGYRRVAWRRQRFRINIALLAAVAAVDPLQLFFADQIADRHEARHRISSTSLVRYHGPMPTINQPDDLFEQIEEDERAALLQRMRELEVTNDTIDPADR